MQVQPSSDLLRFVFLVAYIINMTIMLFIPCYFGSVLSRKSELISGSLFRCNWPQQSVQFKSALAIFMRCSQKPIVLYTLKGLFAIELPTFVTVIRN